MSLSGGTPAIGGALDAVRAPRHIEATEVIHVVGAAGAGASAAALLAAAAGAASSGCDAGGASPYTAALEAAGIELAWAHDASHVAGPPVPTRLAVTKALTAIAPDHPELLAARAAGIAVEPWQQVVADAAVGRTLIGVAGTHGKSTTAGWLTHVLTSAGLDPGAFVGALLPASLTGGIPSTVRAGRGDEFIVEADEYAGNFDAYRPQVAILTSIDWDHPDVFPDRTAVVDAFERWIVAMGEGWTDNRARAHPVLVANVGDPGVAELIRRLDGRSCTVLTYALVPTEPARSTGSGPSIIGRIVDAAPRATTVDILGLPDADRPVRVNLPTAGRHNAANALGVAGAAAAIGVAPEAIVIGLETFPGVGRRLEWKGEVAGVAVYDDYGHHPTAIVETVRAVRQREPGRRVWAAYEPLTYHRAAALHDEFADALATADAVAVARIWAGRDVDTSVDSAEALAASVADRRPGIPVRAPGDVDDTAVWLAGQVRTGDVVLVMGGGRSYRIGERLLELLQGD